MPGCALTERISPYPVYASWLNNRNIRRVLSVI